MKTIKNILLSFCLAVSIIGTQPSLRACDTCGSEAKLTLQFRGIAHLAGHVTISVYVGGNFLTTTTLTGAPAVWNGSRYVAQNFQCAQWPSNLTVQAKLNEPISFHYSYSTDHQSPDYTEFDGTTFNGAPGNPVHYWAPPSSKCLKLWLRSDGGSWIE